MAITVHTHLSPRIVEVSDDITNITVQQILDQIRDWEDDNLSYDKLINAAGKEDLGGEVVVGITATLQNARIMFTGRTTPLESSGTCTTKDLRGRTLYATSGGFVTNEIYEGCTVFNATTGSMSSITKVISETELTSFKITGGSRETWEVGDFYSIYPNVQCNITGGNLVAVTSTGESLSSIMQSPNVQVVRSSSSSATLQELGAIQFASFNGGVTIDQASSYSGVAFPTGTSQQPVNNLNDAMLIADERGFPTLYIIGNMFIDSGGDYSSMTFIGESMSKSILTISSDADVENCEFYETSIQGTLDGNAKLKNCRILNLNYIYGVIEQCMIGPGIIVLGGSEEAHFLDCWSGVVGLSTPVIDCGGSGQALAIRNYNGGIKLINKSGDEKIIIDLNSGQVILDNTITNGTIVVRGIGNLTDGSDGAIISSDALLNVENITKVTWDMVYIDSVYGTTSTGFPLGTKNNPVNNISDALSIAITNQITILHIDGSITFTEDVEGYIVRGNSYHLGTVNMNGKSVLHTSFFNLNITGNGVGNFEAENCKLLSGMTDIEANLENCIMVGEFIVKAGTILNTDRCSSTSMVILNLNGNGFLGSANNSGPYMIRNVTSAASQALFSGSYLMTIEDTCTAGTLLFAGIGILTDNSNGATIIDKTIPGAVWDELIASHLAEGTTGKELKDAGAGGVDVDAIADAVWDEAGSEHTTDGTMGELQNTGGSGSGGGRSLSIPQGKKKRID